MNAVERMVEYTSQPTEGAAQALTRPPPRSWPHDGAITIDNLQVCFCIEVRATSYLPVMPKLHALIVCSAASNLNVVPLHEW